MSAYDEERLARLIGMLPPAPDGWVQAAQELPAARRGLDQLVARGWTPPRAEVHTSKRQFLWAVLRYGFI